MKIIIVGCGKVGCTIAEQLDQEGHNITLVDTNPDILEKMSNTLDVIGVIINLGLIAGELVIVVSGNTRITGDPALFLLRDRRSCEAGQRSRDGGNLLSRFRHGVPSISLS